MSGSHEGVPRSTRWCVLRMAASRTLLVAASLAEAGLPAWTPTISVKRRIPRKPGRVEKPAPLLPTFVFVPEQHLDELLQLSRLPVSQHPAFSLFRFAGEFVFVRDAEITRLRALEAQMKPKRRRPTVELASEVVPTEGAYAGMTGTVIESDGKLTLIAFGGWMEVKIETSALLDTAVYEVTRPKCHAA